MMTGSSYHCLNTKGWAVFSLRPMCPGWIEVGFHSIYQIIIKQNFLGSKLCGKIKYFHTL